MVIWRVVVLWLTLATQAIANTTPAAAMPAFHIYQDADQSHHFTSTNAIQLGIELAFAEVDNQLGGYPVEFIYLDHRGNVIRSLQNLEQFIDDPRALALFSGMHSPPLIKHRDFINQHQILTLVPWAAGGPITRFPDPINWIFRLSIDDTQAGKFLVDFAVPQYCSQPHLLLENTPWGDANLQTISAALAAKAIQPDVTRFNIATQPLSARAILRAIDASNSDCILLVGNAIESATLVKAMSQVPNERSLPIISHWGIAAGDFQARVPASLRKQLSLYFIHSCFSMSEQPLTRYVASIFDRLAQITQDRVTTPTELPAAVGFVHAYDLTKVLIAAAAQTTLTGEAAQDRTAIRHALENLEQPVAGLIKTYQKPFTRYDTEHTNAHEALDSNDYCMAEFNSDGTVKVIPRQ